MSPKLKIFAEDRERNEQGWLLYPRDKQLRANWYEGELLERIMTHPAKQMMYATQDVVEYVSEPGETILDPFGGVGTTLIAATMGRNVVLVEIEDYYFAIIQESIKALMKRGVTAMMLPIKSDNRLALPIPCDHIITSPPYGDDLYKGAQSGNKLATAGQDHLREVNAKEMAQYAQANQNIGRLPKFLYEQTMKKVYRLMVDSVRPGGTISITHRDRMLDGKRVLYIDSIVRTLTQLGMKIKLLEKWEVPRTIQANVNINLGAEVVLDEDILIFEKPL